MGRVEEGMEEALGSRVGKGDGTTRAAGEGDDVGVGLRVDVRVGVRAGVGVKVGDGVQVGTEVGMSVADGMGGTVAVCGGELGEAKARATTGGGSVQTKR